MPDYSYIPDDAIARMLEHATMQVESWTLTLKRAREDVERAESALSYWKDQEANFTLSQQLRRFRDSDRLDIDETL